MELSKEFRFEASHQISNHPGKCANLHGHSWVLVVYVDGYRNLETGMVVDYYNIKQAVQPIIDRLDHTHLGSGRVEVFGSEDGFATDTMWLGPSHEPTLPKLPTSENLLFWIADQIPNNFGWSRLKIKETCTSSASLMYEEYIGYKTRRD